MASFVVYGDTSGQVTVKAPNVAGTNTITFPAETGTMITTTSAAVPNSIVWNTTVQTTGFTAVAKAGYFCNTTSAAFTVTLPATPTRGDFVVIVDYAGTSASNNITVNPNGGKIKGSGVSAILATNRQGITFTYIDSTQGWLPSSNVYGGSTPFAQSYTATYLVVAGGGAGGYSAGGGGGAGGYLTGTTTLTAGTTYTASVGGGGAGVSSGVTGGSGSPSTFTGVTEAVGGGGGGSRPAANAANGGSGGGARDSSPAFGTGTSGQGNNGAIGSGNGGGGGGGAGAAGTTNIPAGSGGGGVGLSNSITGTPTFYAGGGGGAGGTPGTYGPGGNGGGGAGSPGPGNAGTANTGGGGGAIYLSTPSGAGGSGVVILSVPTANYTGTVTGTYTTGTSGSNTWIKWTSGSGTYTA